MERRRPACLPANDPAGSGTDAVTGAATLSARGPDAITGID